MESGVRNSWETFATKSRRTCSSWLTRVMSWKVAATPRISPALSRTGAALMARWRRGGAASVISVHCASPVASALRNTASMAASRSICSAPRPTGAVFRLNNAMKESFTSRITRPTSTTITPSTMLARMACKLNPSSEIWLSSRSRWSTSFSNPMPIPCKAFSPCKMKLEGRPPLPIASIMRPTCRHCSPVCLR